MKTLIVLSVLASFSLAAPAQQGNDFKDAVFQVFQDLRSVPQHMKREKKSPEQSSDTIIHIEPATESHTDDVTSTLIGRNTFKKPLIVKKKMDYHIYRDSDEENANTDSSETCGRHVKVKLCDEDGKFREMFKNSDISKVQILEHDMKNSIKKAKEAVENLQRDLKKMENDNDAIKQADKSETNPNVQDDIEVARQMLQHLQENFGNLTAQSATSRDTEAMHNEHLISAKSEKEKMAQWKDALNTKQNNAEIATNMEDSFTGTAHEQTLENINTKAPLNDQRERDAQIMHLAHSDDDKRSLSDQISVEHIKDVQNRRGQQLEDDMKTSASENIQMKSINIENSHTLISENQEKEKSAMEDITDFHNIPVKSIVEKDVLTNNSISEVSDAESMDSKKKEPFSKQKERVDKENSFKISQNFQKKPIASHESNISLKEPKDHLMQDMNKNIQAKSVEHMLENNQKAKVLEEAKLTDHMERVPNEFALKGFSENIEEQSNSVTKSAEKLHPQKMHDVIEKNENFMNAADQAEQKHKNLSDHKATSSNTKVTEGHFQTSTHGNFDEQQEQLMKSSLLDHRERDSIQNIDYNDTEHLQALEKMKSSEDHVHLTDLFNIDEQHDSFMKAANQAHQTHDNNQNVICNDTDHEESVSITKSYENDSMKIHDHASSHLDNNNNKKMLFEHGGLLKTKYAEDIHLNELHKTNEGNQAVMRVVDHMQQEPKKQQNIHSELNHMSMSTEMKSAEEPWRHHLSTLKSPENHMNHMHHHSHHHADAMHNSHWAHENKPMVSMKAAGDLMKEFQGQDRKMNSHLREDHHMPSKMRVMHDVDLLEHARANVHAAARQHHNMKPNSNVQDMNTMSGSKLQSNLHASMRDAMDGLESDHMFRWLPSHDVPRTAYGGSGASPMSSSGGAVGVFPNANTGGCGIPLLLSCSPSVVSGSLAKPHTPAPPSYSAPSYRTEDNFGFHNKRDVKKTSEGRNTNILRAPADMKPKARTIIATKT